MSLLAEQLITFGMLVGAGMVMAFVFDIYRVFKWLLKLPKLLIHFIDLAIWLAMAVVVFNILILGNWGEVRFYVFLGLMCGLGLYFKFCSKIAVKIFLEILDITRKLAKFIFKVFTYPIKIIGTIMKLIRGY